MEIVKQILTLKILAGARTYLGIGGLWLINIAEWNGFNVPSYDPMSIMDLIMTTLIALGIYEKVKANS